MNTNPLTFEQFFRDLTAADKKAVAAALKADRVYLFQIATGGKARPSGELARRIEDHAREMFGKWVPREWMREDIFGPLAEHPRPARQQAAA